MPTDQELWSLTFDVERDHGEGAPLYIAERLTVAAAAGDATGVATWDGVAERFARLHASARDQ
jgi:hypothetical protein